MEQLSSNNEYVKLESDIKLKNAEFLNALEAMSPGTHDRHVQRAYVL